MAFGIIQECCRSLLVLPDTSTFNFYSKFGNEQPSSFVPSLHSKNSGMNFIPIEYDFHPNEFHTYGMNSVSMTFIPTAVRSSYRECEKTSVIPKLHTALPAMANRVIRSKVQQVGG